MSAKLWACISCERQHRRRKLIACLHALCDQCLEETTRSDGSIKCPGCQTSTQLPPGVGAQYALPNAPRCIAALEKEDDETTTTTALQSQLQRYFCGECAAESPATATCRDCQVQLCATHALSHPLSRSTSGHRVSSLQETTAMGAVEQSSSGSSSAGGGGAAAAAAAGNTGQHARQKCGLHKSASLDHFCTQCYQVMCDRCLESSEHKELGHPVSKIDQLSSQIRGHFEDFRRTVAEDKDTLSAAVECVLYDIKHVNDQAEVASEKVGKFFAYLMKLLREREEALLDGLNQVRLEKVLELEKELSVLQDVLRQVNSAEGAALCCHDDVDSLKLMNWLDIALRRAEEFASEYKDRGLEVRVPSGIVFVRPNTQQVVDAIREAGGVTDLAHGFLQCASPTGRVNEDIEVSLEFVESGKQMLFTTDEARDLGVEIRGGSPECNFVLCPPLPPRPRHLRASFCPPASGEFLLYASVGDISVPFTSCPLRVNDRPHRPSFNVRRLSSRLDVSDNAHCVCNRAGEYGAAFVRHTLNGPVDQLRVRVDRTKVGEVYVCLGTVTDARIDLDMDVALHSSREMKPCFGWNGFSSCDHTEGAWPSQKWRSGDEIQFILDRKQCTLTSRHERTGTVETIKNVAGNLIWFVTLRDAGDQITLL
eukprot:scpid75095/ scgid7271/ E3 ubiquitin-protein ligase TRIM56; Tripartite motif-containing protein 56